MKIAVYHNLESGGANTYLNEITKILKHRGEKVDLYTHKPPKITDIFNHTYVYPLNHRLNIFSELIYIIFRLPAVHRKIAKDIQSNKYNLILVGQCMLTQSPYLLKYLDRSQKLLYILHEPKREFYEQTSFNYFQPKKIISRLIRFPIKIIDYLNCRHAKYIISNSIFSLYKIEKIYKKKSFVVYPGMTNISSKVIHTNFNNKLLSIGLLSFLKGYHFTYQQLQRNSNLRIIGASTNETIVIRKWQKEYHVNVKYLTKTTDKGKIKHLKQKNIFVANQFQEPFGLTTLEATNSEKYVIGLNEGGTPEIIKHGISGFLYPRNIEIAKQVLSSLSKNSKITLRKQVSLNWNKTVDSIYYLYHHFKNTPNE